MGPRTGRVRSGPGAPGRLDHKRGPALGPLRAAGQSECGEPAAGRGALFLLGWSCRTRFLRPNFSDTGLRKYSLVEFFAGRGAESQRAAAVCGAFAGELLSGGSDQGLLRKIQTRCELFSAPRK